MGNTDASVTIPKPESDESAPFPAAEATPIPKANTNGTVTGPVVTAPQSQANPTILDSSGSMNAITLRANVGVKLINMSGFKLHPRRNRTVPITAANPTPNPTKSTVDPERSLSNVKRYGAFSGSTIDPATCRAPMAGSANVTPTPSKNAMQRTPTSGSFLGNVFPITSPNGISPSFKPSMNIMRPTITANRPPAIIEASITGV